MLSKKEESNHWEMFEGSICQYLQVSNNFKINHLINKLITF